MSELRKEDFASVEHYQWVKDNADHKRYEFALTEDSIVFDVGAYKGEWAAEIFRRYGSNIYAFEPVKYFYHRVLNKYWDNPKFKLFNAGLSDTDKADVIYMEGDSTSLHKSSSVPYNIKLLGFNQFIQDNNIASIDLMKLNIEGEEYRLLQSIIEAGNQTKIKNILIQFHDYIDNYANLRQWIHNQLTLTHTLKFNYPFIWECWERNQ